LALARRRAGGPGAGGGLGWAQAMKYA